MASSANGSIEAASYHHDISFKTHDGYTLRGWAYPPLDKGSRPPVVILANGLAGSKEHYLDNFAGYYQKAGFACLAFDHLNWGDSDQPFPRFSDPVYQVSEYISAISFVQNSLGHLVDVDRIAIWGSSYSGGVVMQAAALDPRVKLVLAQVPFVSGEDISKVWPDEMITRLFDDLAAQQAGKPAAYTQLFVQGPNDNKDFPALLGTPDGLEFYERTVKKTGPWITSTPARTFVEMLRFEPRAYIHRIKPRPMLVVVANSDSILTPATAKKLFSEEQSWSGLEFVTFDGGHFDAYEGAAFEEIAPKQVEFLRQWLK